MNSPLVAVLMGSKSDWETMAKTSSMLDELGVEHDVRVLSAHRTPDELFAYIADAEKRGVQVFIAAAGGAAHLAGVIAAKTLLPVLAVPIQSKSLQGLDSLLSMVQMPAGIPVATFAIGEAGATNAAIFATQLLSLKDSGCREALARHRQAQREKVLKQGDPRRS